MSYLNTKKKYNIAFIAQSRFAANLLQDLAPAFGIQFEIHLVAMEQALIAARELLEDSNVDLIISCGSTAKLLQRYLGSRVLDLRHRSIDLIRALQHASQVSRSICLPYYDEIPEGIDSLAELMHLRLVPTVFHDTQELVSAITRSIEDGIYCIVGSNIAKKIAIAQGAHGFEVLFSEEEAKSLLREAVRLIEIHHINNKNNIFINKLSNTLTNKGIIGIDENYNIVFYNNQIADILNNTTYREKIIKSIINNDEVKNSKNNEFCIKIMISDNTSEKLTVYPFELSNNKNGFLVTLDRAEEIHNSTLDKNNNFRSRYSFDNMIGSSSPMKHLKKKAKIFADTDASLLIRGETGTGKELLAHSIHSASSRRNAPFVALNCAALPETLLESELFGYESGAFTGARRTGKDGIFTLAQGGTVYLDEIADISPAVQVRLLRVLESKEIMKVGGDKILPVDVRVISSSWKNLATEVSQGRFRADLYYRLSVLSLTLPPLRARKEDIPELIDSILLKHNLGKHKFSDYVMEKIINYSFPGNIRELDALIQRYCLLLHDKENDDDIFNEIFEDMVHDAYYIFTKTENNQSDEIKIENINNSSILTQLSGSLKERMEKCEKEILHNALVQNAYSKSATAKQLGISQNTLWRKLKSINS